MKKTKNASMIIIVLVLLMPTLGQSQTNVTLKNINNEYHMSFMSESNVTEDLKNSSIEWCKTDTVDGKIVVSCLLKVKEGLFSEILLKSETTTNTRALTCIRMEFSKTEETFYLDNDGSRLFWQASNVLNSAYTVCK